MQLSDEEVALSQQRGNVGEIVGRRVHGNHVEYECVKNGRRTGDTVWEPVVNIKFMVRVPPSRCASFPIGWGLTPRAPPSAAAVRYEDVQELRREDEADGGEDGAPRPHVRGHPAAP